MKQKYFRVSDSDFSAYLFSIGYKPNYIEIKENNKSTNKYKAFVHFDGDKDKLTTLQEKYINGDIQINLKDFSTARQEINKLINSAIRIYKNTNI